MILRQATLTKTRRSLTSPSKRTRTKCAPPCAKCARGLERNIRWSLMAKKLGPAKRLPRSIRARRMMSSVTWPKPEFQKQNARSRPLAAHSKNGDGPHSKNERNYWNEPLRSWTAVASSSPHSRFSKSANRGRKRTAISARQSIFVSFMPSKCDGSDGRA